MLPAEPGLDWLGLGAASCAEAPGCCKPADALEPGELACTTEQWLSAACYSESLHTTTGCDAYISVVLSAGIQWQALRRAVSQHFRRWLVRMGSA